MVARISRQPPTLAGHHPRSPILHIRRRLPRPTPVVPAALPDPTPLPRFPPPTPLFPATLPRPHPLTDDDDDLEFLRKLKEKYGVGDDISNPMSPKPLTTLPPVDYDDDLEFLRNLKEKYGVGDDISNPMSPKPLTNLPPVDYDDDDDFETLRAIHGRFSEYGGGGDGSSAGSCAGSGDADVDGFGAAQEQGWRCDILRKLSSESGSEGKEVAIKSTDDDGGVRKGGRWKSLHSRSFQKPSPSLWRRETPDPFEMLSGADLGNALLKAIEIVNRIFEKMSLPLPGRFKETKDSYKLRFEVPGLSKDELKVTVDEDGVLRITGEKKDEDGDEDDLGISYGYYNTSFALPKDAKEDDIKAELKDGVLILTIPKSENHSKDVKEVKIL